MPRVTERREVRAVCVPSVLSARGIGSGQYRTFNRNYLE